MRRHSPLAWLVAGSFALVSGCTSSALPTPTDAAADATPAESDTTAVDPAPDGPGSPDAPSATSDAALASDSPLALLDVAALPALDSGLWETARRDSSVGEGGSAHGDSRPGGDGTLAVDKSMLNFGILDVGATATGTLTVTNVGRVSTGPLTITVTAGLAATGCSGTLAPGASCVVVVSVTPTAVGPWSGTIAITASPGAVTPLLVSVSAVVGGGPLFAVSPAAIDLGTVLVGLPAPKATIMVTAGIAITDLVVTTTGADLSIDRVASTCTSTLAAGASCAVVVAFTAASSGQKTDALVISGGGAAGKVVSVPITALAQNPAKLAINPSSTQAFAASVGQTSTPITFGVANLGDVATGPIAVTVTGPNAAEFIATTSCLVLEPLAGCTVAVVFKPAADSTTAVTATLTVTDSGPGASWVSVGLYWAHSMPNVLTITPASGDLGTVLVGATSAPTVFTVTSPSSRNRGPLEVTVSSPEFVIGDDTCADATLGPGSTCTISVALRPTSVGAKSAVLTVSDELGAPGIKTLTGTGVTPPEPMASPATLDFGGVPVGSTAAGRTVTIKNQGGSTTGDLVVTKTGSHAVFPISANTCSAALAPGASCAITVTFAPTEARSEAAALTVTDGNVSTTVTMSGNGT